MAYAWWTALAVWSLMPASFALAMGALVGAVSDGGSLTGPLLAAGTVFILGSALSPLQQALATNLGAQTASWLNDRLLEATNAPAGLAHLERPDLAADLGAARDFEYGMGGPDIVTCFPMIGSGLTSLVGAAGQVLVVARYRWWAALVVAAAWGSTHWWFRNAAVWLERHDEEHTRALREAEYAYRMAVEPPAAKEMRVFGLADWTVAGFKERRYGLLDASWAARRLGHRRVAYAVLGIVAANTLVFWSLAGSAADGAVELATVVVLAQAAIGANLLAFGEFDWWLRTGAQPIPMVLGLAERMQSVGHLASGDRSADGLPRRSIEFRGVGFAYQSDPRRVLDGFDLTIPAGRSIAIVGQNGAGKTTLMKLLCRLYDPDDGAILVDGIDLRELDLRSWREQVTAVFQDFVRYELSLRENVAPTGADDDVVRAALEGAGASDLAGLDTVLSRLYEGGTDLSGGQWQRVALARALAAVRLGAGVVVLDEPTAQLDVRGEAEIFERILAATRSCTTILVSHRFSTVRHADRICVLEDGRVVELGSHDELMALGGRYRTMFDLQAQRFAAGLAVDEAEAEVALDVLA